MGTAYGEYLTAGAIPLFVRKTGGINLLNEKFQTEARIDFADYMIKKFSNTNN